MAKIPLNKKDFNNFIESDYELFRRRCSFTEDQLKILNGFQKDWTEIKIRDHYNFYSKTAYDKLVRQVKQKIIRVLAENEIPLKQWEQD